MASAAPRDPPKASGKTGLPVETFPPTSRWTAEQVLTADFWLEG
jgi:hypothetical protein